MTDTTPLERAAQAEFAYWAEGDLWAAQDEPTQNAYRIAARDGLTAALDVEEMTQEAARHEAWTVADTYIRCMCGAYVEQTNAAPRADERAMFRHLVEAVRNGVIRGAS